MTTITRNLSLELVRVTEAAALTAGRWMGRGDKEAAIAAFADDASIFDPHYPQPLMRGKAAIRAGGAVWSIPTQKETPRHTPRRF